MKVILLSDVKNLGKKNDIVEVNNGYANNYLIPRKLAVVLSKTSLDIKKTEEADVAKKEAMKKNDALKLKEELKTKETIIEVKLGEEGKMFGSISSKTISDKLKEEHNIIIDRRKFIKFKNITQLGYYKINVELYKDVIGEINIQVIEK